jgi:hypothetical protein
MIEPRELAIRKELHLKDKAFIAKAQFDDPLAFAGMKFTIERLHGEAERLITEVEHLTGALTEIANYKAPRIWLGDIEKAARKALE